MAKDVSMMVCPSCGEAAPEGASWCEACGADLAGPAAGAASAESTPAVVATSPCVSCDAPAHDITHDGYCQQCGQRQPSPRDHQVVDLGWIAGVSDKGRKHHRNEDAMAFEVHAPDAGDGGIDAPAELAPRHGVLVVCDGVSSTERPDEASAAAATAALDSLMDSAGDAAAFGVATASAKAKVSEVWRSSPQAGDPPSCTLVGVVANETAGSPGTPGRIQATIGWLGDSRVYWFGTGDPQLLTRDHSWAEAQREIGELEEATITADPRAHSITRWIGIDAGDVTPEVATFTFDGPGMLVVCSDGLWNYASEPADLAAVIAERSTGGAATPVALAESLVAFANEGGGHDNITVVIASFETGEMIRG